MMGNLFFTWQYSSSQFGRWPTTLRTSSHIRGPDHPLFHANIPPIFSINSSIGLDLVASHRSLAGLYYPIDVLFFSPNHNKSIIPPPASGHSICLGKYN